MNSRAALFLSSLILNALLALALAGCGSEDGRDECTGGNFCVGEAPRLALEPGSLTFAAVALGSEDHQILTVRNSGESELVVTAVTLGGADAAAFDYTLEPGASRDDALLALAPDASAEVLVTFRPERVGGAAAELCFESSDPVSPVTCAALSAVETGPRPQVTPDPILFGLVDAGAEASLEVAITNVGTAPLELTGVALDGSPDFAPERGTRDAVLHDAMDRALEPGEATQVTLWYRPDSPAPDTGELVVHYRFGAELRRHATAIVGNGEEPCVRVRPDAIDFGATAIGAVGEQIVAIENCGSAPLEVTQLVLRDDSDPAFVLTMVPQVLQDGGVLELQPGQLRQLYVGYAPVAEEAASGTLVVDSNDAARPRVEVPIVGVGSTNNCPLAAAQGQIVRDASGNALATPSAPAAALEAEVLETLRLRPTGSSDPDGDALVEYRWSIVEAPPGFSVGFVPHALAEEVELQLALIGDYVFELTVVDARGMATCAPARVSVTARSEKRLVIELTWRTPSDLDETDVGVGFGSDLDLHLLDGSLSARWDDALSGAVRGDTDCYFANPQPEWGSASSEDDDPALDRDDTDGGGPEQINIREPARTDDPGGILGGGGYTRPYQVGVYFYDAHGHAPPVHATLRIYLDGSATPAAVWPTASNGRTLSAADPSLQRQGDFWLAGEIDWTEAGGTPREVDTVQSGFPD